MIGICNEHSLHASLKEHYRRPGDQAEAKVDGFIIDLLQADRLLEIQTSNFTALKNKLGALLTAHAVHLVHPIAVERHLVRVDPESGELLNSRRSPKKGTVYDLFSELIRIPHLIAHHNFSLEAVFVVDQEIRCADGMGSWRRGGVSILDRCLLQIVGKRIFSSPADYLEVLPQDLPSPFTNRQLAQAAQISVFTARKVSYTLKKAGFVREIGKEGNAILHQVD